MKNKKYILRTVKILSLLLALVVCIGFLQEYVLCHADHNRERVFGFYLEPRNSVDVVLIGASEVYADYAAGYAYEKYGYTSYPIATQSNIIQNYKTQVKEAMRTQNPKLIVVEVNGALYGSNENIESEANLRNYSDNIPLNSNKVELVSNNATSDQLEYYMTISKYHSVWKDFPNGLGWTRTLLQEKLRGYTYLKGAKSKTAIYNTSKVKNYNSTLKNDNKTKNLNPTSEQYFREFLDFCKSENLDNVVFVRFPHVVTKKTYDRFHRSNEIGNIIAEYGYDYINCEKDFEDTGIDISKDFYNAEHLNAYGQRHFTEYLGQIIRDRYLKADSDLDATQKERWDTSAKYYDAYYKYNVDLLESGKCKQVSEYYSELKEIEKYL